MTEKLNRDLDNLTPLDARNSLLLNPGEMYQGAARAPMVAGHPSSPPRKGFLDEPYHDDTAYQPHHRPVGSRDHLDSHSLSGNTLRSPSPNPSMRAPLLPEIDMGYRNRGY
jgi:hypothetical protein